MTLAPIVLWLNEVLTAIVDKFPIEMISLFTKIRLD